MSKEFYTEQDIEDLVRRGVRSLQLTDDVVLTELAYEKAQRLGLQLVTNGGGNPPGGPVRPYISEPQTARPVPTIGPDSAGVEAHAPAPAREPAAASSQDTTANDVTERIRSAVIARLGNQVDAKLLDNIIHRVVKSVGLK